MFFVLEGDAKGPLVAVPLHCYDAAAKKLTSGDAFLKLVPEGAVVHTNVGPLTVGAKTQPQCPVSPAMSAVKLLGKPQPRGAGAVDFLYGIWPQPEAARFAILPASNPVGAMAPVEQLVRHGLQVALGRGVADLFIYQILNIALGSEGPRQRLYSVAVPASRKVTGWSGLLLGDAAGRTARVLDEDKVAAGGQHSLQLVAKMDLDHNGKLELLANTGGDQIDRYAIRIWDGTNLPATSDWSSCELK